MAKRIRGEDGGRDEAGGLPPGKAREIQSKRAKKADEERQLTVFVAKVLSTLDVMQRVAPGRMSLSQILALLDISDSMFSRWKKSGKGKLTAFNALSLAHYLDVDLEWLIDERIQTPPQPSLRRIGGALKRALGGRIGIEEAFELALKVVEAERAAESRPAAAGTTVAASKAPKPGRGPGGSEQDTDGVDEPRREPKGRPR